MAPLPEADEETSQETAEGTGFDNVLGQLDLLPMGEEQVAVLSDTQDVNDFFGLLA